MRWKMLALTMAVGLTGCSSMCAPTGLPTMHVEMMDLSDFAQFEYGLVAGCSVAKPDMCSAIIQREDDSRYRLEMSLATPDTACCPDCEGGPWFSCGRVDELPVRYLSEGEVSRLLGLFAALRVAVWTNFPICYMRGSVRHFRWDDLDLGDWPSCGPGPMRIMDGEQQEELITLLKAFRDSAE